MRRVDNCLYIAQLMLQWGKELYILGRLFILVILSIDKSSVIAQDLYHWNILENLDFDAIRFSFFKYTSRGST